MNPILIALLAVDGVLLIVLIAYIVYAVINSDKKEVVSEEIQTDEKAEEVSETVTETEPENEVSEEVAETEPEEIQTESVTETEPENEASETVTETEPENEASETVAEAEPENEVSEAVTETEEKKAPVIVPIVNNEDPEDDRDIAKRIPFAKKMLELDVKTQEYYDQLNNAFRAMRRVNSRISIKGASYRLGRDLIAKITVRGKTMKLHLALDVKKFDENIYFQKDLSDVKAYAEVPFTVKVKSDRGLKNAMKLLEELMTEKSIEKKARHIYVNSLDQLKESVSEEE